MKNATIIAITNQKGGVGKTTTTVNLGVGLAQMGKRVLLVDADPQGSLSISLGLLQPDAEEDTLADLLSQVIREKPISLPAAIRRHTEGVDYIPANLDLATLEVTMVSVISRETILRQLLAPLRGQYDYILIDCLPSLGLLALNALAAADRVIIPVETDFLPAKGVEQLLRTVSRVQRQINPQLCIAGILPTKVNHTNASRAVLDIIQNVFGSRVYIFSTSIPKGVSAVDASASGESVFECAPRSKVALAYAALAEEVVQHG